MKTGELEPLMSALTEEEGEQFKNMLSRIHTVFQAAKDMDVRVMVDAEQTYFQPAISRITMEMMTKYNKEKAVVFNTYQCYLKEAYNNLILDLEQSDRFGNGNFTLLTLILSAGKTSSLVLSLFEAPT